MKKIIVLFTIIVVTIFLPVVADAANSMPNLPGITGDLTELFKVVGKGIAALGGGLAVMGAGIGIGRIGGDGLTAISRQPEKIGDIRSNMIIMAALVEGLAVFVIVIVLLVCFS